MKPSKQFIRMLRIIGRFSTGYNPHVNVYLQFDFTKGKPYDGIPLNAVEAFYLWESEGVNAYSNCSDKEGFRELIERKSCMDLTVQMWKETIKDYGPWTSHGRVACIGLIGELAREFPITWLQQIGLLELVGTDIRKIGQFNGAQRLK